MDDQLLKMVISIILIFMDGSNTHGVQANEVPEITKEHELLEVAEGETVRIPCNIKSSETNRRYICWRRLYQWYTSTIYCYENGQVKAGYGFTETEFYDFSPESNDLIIQNVDPTRVGTYICEVRVNFMFYLKTTHSVTLKKNEPAYKEGIDISHHNGKIDWTKLTPSNTNITFIIAKATEGATVQDPTFLHNFAKLCAAGFQPGAYHFLRFGSSSARDQMENFLSQIEKAKETAAGLGNKELIIALDVEEGKGTAGSDYSLVSSVVEECVLYLKNRSITPFIYTRENFWNSHVKSTPAIVKDCPLWISRYRNTAPSLTELPNGWEQKGWKIWQYSETGSVPGITGNVDLNKMK